MADGTEIKCLNFKLL